MPTWSNWSGSASCTPATILRPSSEAAIAAAVHSAVSTRQEVRVVGSGHSFTPLVTTNGMLISLDEYQGLESVDTQAGIATIRAGTKIKALGEALHTHGVAQENMGDIDVQSIAGAIGTGTHGTGIGLGSISTQVVGLRIVTATSEILELSETQHPELLNAARVSLGTFGVISSIALRVVPAFRLHYTWRREDVTSLLTNLSIERSRNRNFEFYWIPHTNVALVKRMNSTDQPAKPNNIMRKLNDLILENGAFWVLSEICRLRPSASAGVARLMGSLVSGGADINYSHLIYATQRLVRFNEMEYSLPADQLAEALEEIRSLIARERIEVHFPIECRYTHGDTIPLGTANGRDSAYIAVHMYKGMAYQRYFGAVEAIFRRRGGRPHWGKLHTRSATELRNLYPQWDAFHTFRRQLDPHGMFLNPYLKGLFGE